MKLSLGITPRDYSVAGAVTYDTDALAYFTANTEITSAADKNAINTFYLGLKSDGIYTKIKAMYLPIWGSATSSKWNLINPLDTKEAFRLTFHGTSWTYSTSGITPNNAYADTYLAPSSYYSTNIHLSYYSRTSTIATTVEIGSTHIFSLQNYYAFLATARNFITGQTTNGTVTYLSQANSLGFFVGNKLTNSSRKVFRNGSLNNSTTTTDANSLSNVNVYLGALNNNNTGGANFSSKQCSFASIGDGLTDAEISNFHSRVNTLMTYFGINV